MTFAYSDNPFGAIMGLGVLGCSSVVVLFLYILFALSMGKILDEVGQGDKKILAWIPVINVATLPIAAGVPLWTLILVIIPFVNLFYYLYLSWKIGERVGASSVKNLIALLLNLFLPPFGYVLLAYF